MCIHSNTDVTAMIMSVVHNDNDNSYDDHINGYNGNYDDDTSHPKTIMATMRVIYIFVIMIKIMINVSVLGWKDCVDIRGEGWVLAHSDHPGRERGQHAGQGQGKA